MKMLRVLLIEPLREPRLVEIEYTLDEMQRLVGGLIQAIYPWDDPVALVCDDEGKLKGSTPNRMLEDYDIITGPFFICGIGEDDFISISDELAEKYTAKFKYPELIYRNSLSFKRATMSTLTFSLRRFMKSTIKILVSTIFRRHSAAAGSLPNASEEAHLSNAPVQVLQACRTDRTP